MVKFLRFKHIDNYFKRKINYNIIHIDCPEGFMCNYNDCVAKKKEGSLCLSGKDIECKCGKCTLDEENWTYVCLNEDADSCVDDGN